VIETQKCLKSLYWIVQNEFISNITKTIKRRIKLKEEKIVLNSTLIMKTRIPPPSVRLRWVLGANEV
jgi:hypothetical protein